MAAFELAGCGMLALREHPRLSCLSIGRGLAGDRGSRIGVTTRTRQFGWWFSARAVLQRRNLIEPQSDSVLCSRMHEQRTLLGNIARA